MLKFLTLKIRIKNLFSSTNTESYLLANRSTKCLPLAFTLAMTELNPASMLAFSSMGYMAEWRGLLMSLIVLSSMLFYGLLAAKKWRMNNILCVSEFFYTMYGSKIGRFACFVLYISMVILNAVYLKSMVLFIEYESHAYNAFILSGIIMCIAVLLTIKEGLRSVIKLDSYSLLIVAIFIISCYFSIYKMGSYSCNYDDIFYSFKEHHHILSSDFIITYIIMSCFTYVLMPGYSQKVFSAKNEHTAKKSSLIAAIIVFVLYFLAILSTIFLKKSGIKIELSELALPFIYHNFLPNYIKPLAFLSFMLIGLTTLCGMLSAMSAMLVSAIRRTSIKRTEHFGPYMTILSSILSYLMYLFAKESVMTYLVIINIALFSLSFSVLAGFYWKKVKVWGAYASISTTLTWGVSAYFLLEDSFQTVKSMVIGIPCIFLVGFIASFLEGYHMQKYQNIKQL